MIILVPTLFSCSKTATNVEKATAMEDEVSSLATTSQYCKSETVCLWAGQTINAGSVVISNDATNLYIKVVSTEGFQTVPDNIKIWVGTDWANLPVSGGGAPIPGQFPYKYNATGTEIMVTIPFDKITVDGKPVTCNSSKLYVLVHVDIIAGGGSETAWGGCLPGTDTNRWYFYHLYTTACCDVPPPPPSCYSQTAFAKGGWVFTTDKKSNPESLPSLNLTKNRWGWAINLTTTGTTTYQIWAGAGLNRTANAKLAGALTVNWDGMIAVVTYTMNGGFTLVETHVYAGDDKPLTLAPGQYGNTMSFDPPASSYTGTYSVSDTNGDGIWLIAHAGVYGCY